MTLVPEIERLNALQEYHILDSATEASYENIVRLAAEICETPMAAITFVDSERLWIKASVGFEVKEIPRGISLCSEAINHKSPYIVEDATRHPQFKDNPLVTGSPYLRFYTGFRLTSQAGYAIGALCVCDVKPRSLNEQQLTMLASLTGLASRQLEVRRLVYRTKAQNLRLVSSFSEHTVMAGGNRASATSHPTICP